MVTAWLWSCAGQATSLVSLATLQEAEERHQVRVSATGSLPSNHSGESLSHCNKQTEETRHPNSEPPRPATTQSSPIRKELAERGLNVLLLLKSGSSVIKAHGCTAQQAEVPRCGKRLVTSKLEVTHVD